MPEPMTTAMTNSSKAAGADDREWLDPAGLRRGVSALLQGGGLAAAASDLVAEALVDADVAGVPSHGVMLVPMYLERLRAGSVSTTVSARVVEDGGSTLVLDAGNAFGQVTSDQAVRLLRERAPAHGMAAVAVRNAFHFGAAGRWASQLAESGLIGIVMSNTRPLMPAPGGAGKVVGNNPLAIAMPSATDTPIVVDMALSAGAMGKIRLAAASGDAIPSGWAVDARGGPTTDPAKALEGMLLPAGGAKGFGLAFMVDLFCGGLASGAIGGQVRALYGDAATPYGCAHFFAAIDVRRFLPLEQFSARASAFADSVRASPRAEGVDRLFSPGERSWANRRRHAGSCPVGQPTMQRLRALAAEAGLDAPDLFQSSRNKDDS